MASSKRKRKGSNGGRRGRLGRTGPVKSRPTADLAIRAQEMSFDPRELLSAGEIDSASRREADILFEARIELERRGVKAPRVRPKKDKRFGVPVQEVRRKKKKADRKPSRRRRK